MPKLLSTTALACALTLLTCCQLNDHDSAPRAPDLGEEERDESVDPAALGTHSGGGSNGPAAADSGATGGGAALPAATSDAALPMPTTFPGLEAGTASPVLPVLPGLEAGTLAPANPRP